MGSLNSGILSVPVDIVALVVNNLSFQDALVLGMTCRSLHTAASSDIVWLEKCKVWAREIRLEDWRQAADSGKALFRLLRYLSRFRDVWSSQDLSPRGGVLYTTWGNFSLVSWKIIPESLARVSFVPLFEVIGSPDGSTKVELVSRVRDTRLPAGLTWLSEREFQLEVFGAHGSMRSECPDLEENADDGHTALSLTLQQNLLLRGFALGPDDQRISSPSEGNQHGFGLRTLQYLKRLSSFRNGRTSIPAELKGIKSSYRRVELESTPEHKLTGLWSGIYGPHGLELVAIQYSDSRIIGLKVLGDPHVPCNEITFQVDRATESRNISSDLRRLANLLTVPGTDRAVDIVTTYRGTGRIAGFNFKNPQWVPGQLLVHDNNSLSFLWEDVNFVIRFQRLELSTLFSGEGSDQVLPRRL